MKYCISRQPWDGRGSYVPLWDIARSLGVEVRGPYGGLEMDVASRFLDEEVEALKYSGVTDAGEINRALSEWVSARSPVPVKIVAGVPPAAHTESPLGAPDIKDPFVMTGGRQWICGWLEWLLTACLTLRNAGSGCVGEWEYAHAYTTSLWQVLKTDRWYPCVPVRVTRALLWAELYVYEHGFGAEPGFLMRLLHDAGEAMVEVGMVD